MTDSDAKEWVTIKVPVSDRDTANDNRPDGATYGDCLVAGAKALGDGGTVDLYEAGNTEPVKTVSAEGPVLSDDDVQEIINCIGAEVGGPTVDSDGLAREVAAQIDYTALADKVADEVVGRLR